MAILLTSLPRFQLVSRTSGTRILPATNNHPSPLLSVRRLFQLFRSSFGLRPLSALSRKSGCSISPDLNGGNEKNER